MCKVANPPDEELFVSLGETGLYQANTQLHLQIFCCVLLAESLDFIGSELTATPAMWNSIFFALLWIIHGLFVSAPPSIGPSPPTLYERGIDTLLDTLP